MCAQNVVEHSISTSIIQHHSNYASVSRNTFVLLHFMAIIPLNYIYFKMTFFGVDQDLG